MRNNVKGLAHIGLYVSNIAHSREFYTKVLGFDCMLQTETADGTKLCFMRNGDCEIELIEVSGAQTDGFFNHVCLKVTDIEAALKAVKDAGYEPEAEIKEMPMIYNGIKMVMFRGPDGERLEFNEFL